MIANLLRPFSDTQIIVLLPLAACLLLGILAIVFRRFQKHLRLVEYDSDILDTATQNTMSGAYVILGFVLVLAMTTVADLESAVSKEATAIKSLERMLVLDGGKATMASRELLISYTRSVIKDEWPILKNGHGNPETSNALQKLFLSMDAIEPTSPKDTVLYSKILDQADKVAELRNARILNVQSYLPNVFYIVSVVSLLGVIVIAALRLIEATTIRSVALATQVIMLTLLFSAIMIIDLPYLGDTVTSPDALETALDSIVNRKVYN